MPSTVLTVNDPKKEWVVNLPPNVSIMTSFYGMCKGHSLKRGKPLSSWFSKIKDKTVPNSFEGYFTMSDVAFDYRRDQLTVEFRGPATGQILVSFEYIKDLWKPDGFPDQVYFKPDPMG